MVQEPIPVSGEQGKAVLTAQEERFRALHALRAEARLVEGFETAYVSFVRTLRERLHPRGVPDIRTVTLDDGLVLSVDVGDRLGCDVFYGYYEEAFDARIFTGSVLPGATVVDIGANFGFYSLQSARAIGPVGQVHAFEPDPNALAVLRRNIAANGFEERVSAWQVAVGQADGTVELQLAAESAFTSLRPTGRSELRGSVEVPLRSLDSFAAEQGIGSIDALKIDAEGLEGPILRGARALLLASTDPIIQLEVSAKNLTDALQGELADELGALLGAGFLALRPDAGHLHGLEAFSDASDVARLTTCNVFLVRAGGPAESRLRRVTAEMLGSATTLLAVESVDADRREVAIYAGLDPVVVAAALKDYAALRQRVVKLEALRDGDHRTPASPAPLRSEQRAQAVLARQLSATRHVLHEVAAQRDELARAREQSDAVVARQSAEVDELRRALERASTTIEHQQAELESNRACLDSDDPQESWRALAGRQELEIEQLRKSVAHMQERLDEWRALGKRLSAENDDRLQQIERAQRHIVEERELIDQLWAKLAAARADRDTLQERCTEQMHEICRLRQALDVEQVDQRGGNVRRLS